MEARPLGTRVQKRPPSSVGVARLGGQAHYWGRLGDDSLGDRILADLAREGVDVASVRRLPGRTSPSAAILIDVAGERLVCAYNDPKLDTDPGWLPLNRIAEFAAVLVDVTTSLERDIGHQVLQLHLLNAER